MTVPAIRSAPFRETVTQRPLDRSSPQGKAAVKRALDQLHAQGISADLVARSVEQDSLGMTHVRFGRWVHGLPVFDEQVIAHLDKNGGLSTVTGTAPAIPKLQVERTRLSEREAAATALQAFGAKPEASPSIEKVVARADDGAYRVAYRVECVDTGSSAGPKRQSYLIDADTGQVLREWSTIHAVEAAAAPKVVERRFTPNAPIRDNDAQSFTFTVDDRFRAGEVILDVDIEHENRSDLVVSLTAPSGKRVFLTNQDGGFGARGLKGRYDLYGVLDRQPVNGEWKLTVQDTADGDTGSLRSWGMRFTEGDARPSVRPALGADDRSVHSGLVDVSARKNADGRYELVDTSRGQGVETRDANYAAGGTSSKPIFDNNDVWGEATDDPRQRIAVEVQFGAQTTYDYFRDVLGRDSIDGLGEKLVNQIHSGEAWGNAMWDGAQMHYGEVQRTGSAIACLDVAGHEITHGLTDRTADLEYWGESGGLNEAMSDILGGAGVEWYALAVHPELQGVLQPYVMGEQLAGPGERPLRDFADPTSDGESLDHYRSYTDGTDNHFSSGIANNAFYLLTHGGTNKTSNHEVKDGIGMERGLKIFGRALMHYMRPTTTFSEARAATIQAATDLYGATSIDVQKVKEAWTAVGVLS